MVTHFLVGGGVEDETTVHAYLCTRFWKLEHYRLVDEMALREKWDNSSCKLDAGHSNTTTQQCLQCHGSQFSCRCLLLFCLEFPF